MSTDWADRKIAETEDARVTNQLRLNAQITVRAEAPFLWDQLVTLLRENAEKYSGAPGMPKTLRFRQSSDTEVVLTASPKPATEINAAQTKTLTLTFDKLAPGIDYKLVGGPTEELIVNRARLCGFRTMGDEVWLCEKDGSTCTTPAAAERLLDIMVEDLPQ